MHTRRLRHVARHIAVPAAAAEAAAAPPAGAADDDAAAAATGGELHGSPTESDDAAAFQADGYLVCPGLLSGEHVAALTADFDDYMRQAGFSERHGTEDNFEESSTERLTQPTQSPVLGALPTYRPLVDRIAALMAANCRANPDALPTFSLHHQHALRAVPGDTGSDWHHDYEQYPQRDRDLLMCHAFVYPHGLKGEIGDLIVLPGSHKTVLGRDTIGSLFQQAELPGALSFGSGIPLPNGSVVIVNSALVHGRRAMPGGERSGPRYFSDISYCQHSRSRQLWPSYQMFHKPGGRDDTAAIGGHADFCKLHLAAGRGGENGELDYVFDPSWFYSSDTEGSNGPEVAGDSPWRD